MKTKRNTYLSDKKTGELAEEYFAAVLSKILNSNDNILYITNNLKLANQIDNFYIPIKSKTKNGKWKNDFAFKAGKEFLFHIVNQHTMILTPISALKAYAKHTTRILKTDDKQYLIIPPACLPTLGTNRYLTRYNKDIRNDIISSSKDIAVHWDLKLESQDDKTAYKQSLPKKYLSNFGNGCKFEIKRDKISFFTKNYFIEVAKRYVRSKAIVKKGLSISTADYYVFSAGQSFLITKTHYLQKVIGQYEKETKAYKTGGQGAIGLLIKIKELMSTEYLNVTEEQFQQATGVNIVDSDISILVK